MKSLENLNKFKNWPRPLFRLRANPTCHQKPNPSHETVPYREFLLSEIILSESYLSAANSPQPILLSSANPQQILLVLSQPSCPQPTLPSQSSCHQQIPPVLSQSFYSEPTLLSSANTFVLIQPSSANLPLPQPILTVFT